MPVIGISLVMPPTTTKTCTAINKEKPVARSLVNDLWERTANVEPRADDQ